MQTQYYPHPFHHQDIYHMQPSYLGQAASSNFASPTGLDLTNFSRGSSLSYPHQEYRHHTDRGGPLGLAGPPPSLSNASLCATGLGIPGHSVSNGNGFQAEAIVDFPLQQQWQWTTAPESLHGLPLAPVPRAPQAQLAEHEFSSIKRSPADYATESSAVLSPAAQRPTPASMAVLLNQTARAERNSPQVSFRAPSDAARSSQAQSVSMTQPVEVPQHPAQPVQTHEDGLSRERKHACTMCHKRFDRPSTLKKHFLVHTGEKAFVCDTCGRRFGVPSNLNRHVRRCILKPVNASHAAGKQQQLAAGGTVRRNEPSSPSSNSEKASSPGRPVTSPPSRQSRPPGAPKRRRRAPSPSRWIPPSLLSFNLTPPEAKKCTPVPLPPVRRNLPKEERDSWDENISSTPYHPRGWKNVLPGPGLGLGLGGKDVRNLNIGSNGGYMLGRVLVLDLNHGEERP
ncbi:hypothetical protein H2248_000197 [Termitomyces sp. 'cryptogamus']|nr:hypothetical protein H2248_000197 [Termitomyces sp. 'cryptogamus']